MLRGTVAAGVHKAAICVECVCVERPNSTIAAQVRYSNLFSFHSDGFLSVTTYCCVAPDGMQARRDGRALSLFFYGGEGKLRILLGFCPFGKKQCKGQKWIMARAPPIQLGFWNGVDGIDIILPTT